MTTDTATDTLGLSALTALGSLVVGRKDKTEEANPDANDSAEYTIDELSLIHI